MSTAPTDTPDLAATAAAAPIVGLPQMQRTWVDEPRNIATLLRQHPGDPDVHDSLPGAGWRLVGWSDDRADRPKLSSDAMRIRTKETGDPNKGVLAPFRVTPDHAGRVGMFEASVSSDPLAPGRTHAVELYARWLTPTDATVVRKRRGVIRQSGGKRITHRGGRREETPSSRVERIAAAAAHRQTVKSRTTTKETNQ